MSDYETDPGHDDGASYGHYEAGAQSGELEELHQAQGSASDYNSDFNVYSQEHEAAESTDFQQGSHVEYESPTGASYEESNFTNYSNDSYEKDSVFAAEGSTSAHEEQFSQLDALRAEFDSAFAQGTVIEGGDNPAAELGPAS